MGETTLISWCDATLNFWYGCNKISEGCKNCYAERDLKRFGKNFREIIRSERSYKKPYLWARTNKVAHGSRIFVCSWSDFFLDTVPEDWRSQAWNTIRDTPYIYILLTKRPENILKMLPSDWNNGYQNVYLGVSVESNKHVHRVDELSKIPARVRFASLEPLLEYVDLRIHLYEGYLDWVITGGESDSSHPRKMELDWVRRIDEDCRRMSVPMFHKQHGGLTSHKIDNVYGGCRIDGRIVHEFPTQEKRIKYELTTMPLLPF